MISHTHNKILKQKNFTEGGFEGAPKLSKAFFLRLILWQNYETLEVPTQTSLRSGCLGGMSKTWRKKNARGEGEGKEEKTACPETGLSTHNPQSATWQLSCHRSVKMSNITQNQNKPTSRLAAHGTKMYLMLAVKGEEEKQKKKVWMITADYVLECTLLKTKVWCLWENRMHFNRQSVQKIKPAKGFFSAARQIVWRFAWGAGGEIV